MYFEEILIRSAENWGEQIDAPKIGGYYLRYVDKVWMRYPEKYKYWVQCLDWSIAVCLQEFSNEFINQDHVKIGLSVLKVRDVEFDLSKSLLIPSWEKELSLYKGLKVQPE